MTKAPRQVLYGKRKLVIGTADPLYGNNSIRTSKYTLATFFFLNLLEQFKKPANDYFLVLSVLQVIKAISISDGQPTILLPLAFVIVVAMIKDFLEDWKRTKSDREENQLPVMVLRNGQFVKAASQTLLTGDIVKVSRDNFIPADLVLLWSSGPKSDCFLETKNLDGETNLKQKFVDPKARAITNNNPDLKGILGLRMDCEEPNVLLENFTGSIHPQNDKEFALDNSNVVLRGCKLKTTETIIGVVIFTGHFTKIMMNSIKAKPKSSDLEKKLGMQIFLVFGMLVVLCTIAAAMYVTWYTDNKNFIPYLDLGDLNAFGEFWVRLGNWILIFG